MLEPSSSINVIFVTPRKENKGKGSFTCQGISAFAIVVINVTNGCHSLGAMSFKAFDLSYL